MRVSLGVVGFTVLRLIATKNEDTVRCRYCGILSRGGAIEFTDRYLVKQREEQRKMRLLFVVRAVPRGTVHNFAAIFLKIE